MNEKYTELIKEIAGIITDGERERYWLKIELDETRDLLARAEERIAQLESEQRYEGCDGVMEAKSC